MNQNETAQSAYDKMVSIHFWEVLPAGFPIRGLVYASIDHLISWAERNSVNVHRTRWDHNGDGRRYVESLPVLESLLGIFLVQELRSIAEDLRDLGVEEAWHAMSYVAHRVRREWYAEQDAQRGNSDFLIREKNPEYQRSNGIGMRF